MIDGYTQPNAKANAVILIEFKQYIQLLGGSTVRGLAGVGVILGNDKGGGGGNTNAGNFIGLGAKGNGSGTKGPNILSQSNNVIGGAEPKDRNVISWTIDDGVTVLGGQGNIIEGNFIGTDASGKKAAGNDGSGIRTTGGGGHNLIRDNVISANALSGIILGTTGDIVQGNRIGTDESGLAPLGNGSASIGAGSNAVIGGSLASQGNVIAYNGFKAMRPGVYTGAGGVSILSNSIFSNAQLGIVAYPPGQAAPVLTSATTSRVTGTVTGKPGTTLQLQFFSNDAADAAGQYEGQHLIGSTSVTTDVCGKALISASFSAPSGSFVTATATDATNDTSPFSKAVQATGVTVTKPHAVNDTATTQDTASVMIPVLANDTTPDGGPLTITSVSSSVAGGIPNKSKHGGRLEIDGNQVRYEPPALFLDTDNFVYTIQNKTGGTNYASVAITVFHQAVPVSIQLGLREAPTVQNLGDEKLYE